MGCCVRVRVFYWLTNNTPNAESNITVDALVTETSIRLVPLGHLKLYTHSWSGADLRFLGDGGGGGVVQN